MVRNLGRLLLALVFGSFSLRPVLAQQPTPPMLENSDISLEVNIPVKELTVFDHGKAVESFPVAIGQLAYKSIVMQDAIKVVEWNPWWFPPPSPWARDEHITPPGPHNPLGPVKMALGNGIRIHGTNKDKSVGRAASHGCFRMHNEDAIKLGWYLQSHLTEQKDPSLLATYAQNRRRTYHVALSQPVPVKVVYEPVVLRDRFLYLYPDVYGRIHNWFETIASVLQSNGISTGQLSTQRVNELKRILKQDLLTVSISDLLNQPEQADQADLDTSFAQLFP